MEYPQDMDETCPGRVTEEVEIDLQDLLGELFIHWKGILAVALLAALLVGGFGFRKTERDNSKALTVQTDLDKAREKLTGEEIREVDRLYDEYRMYKSGEEALQEYSAHSFLMTLSPETVVGMGNLYAIQSSPLSAGGDFFGSSLITREDYEKIGQLVGLEGRHVRDAVRIKYIGNSSSALSASPEDLLTTSLDIHVYAPTQEIGRQMLDIVDEAVSRRTRAMAGADDRVRAVRIEQYTDENAMGEILDLQKNQAANITSLIRTRASYDTDILSKVNKEQKTYLDLLRLRDEPERLKKQGWLKYPVIGFVVGAFLMACGIAVRYIFAGLVRSDSDLTARTGRPVFQGIEVPSQKKHDPLVTLGFRLKGIRGAGQESEEDRIRMICQEIRSFSERKDFHSVHILADERTEAIRSVAERIERGLQGLKVSRSPLQVESGGMERLLQADSAVMLVGKDVSRTTDARQASMLCARVQKPVYGAVLVRGDLTGRK